MTDTTLRRVIWKEYRLQRGLWLVIAAFVVVVQLLVLVSAGLAGQSVQPYTLFTIAMAMPVIYALGSGAMLFAGEREAETYEFQRSLPVSGGRVAAGKLAYAAVSAAVLLLLAWLSAWAFSAGELPRPAEHLWLWIGSVLALLEILAWTVLFSLLLRSVLWAAILGPVAAVLLGVLAVPYSLAGVGAPFSNPLDDFAATIPIRLVLTGLVWASSVWLSRRWFGEHTLGKRIAATLDSIAARRGAAASSRSGSGIAFVHLLWQAARQMRGALAAILLGTGLLVIWMMAVTYDSSSRSPEWAPLIVPWFYLPLLAALLGSCLFWSDQRRETYRYFAERGVASRLVWLSRHAIAVAVLLGWAALAIGCLVVDSRRPGSDFQLTRVATAGLPAGAASDYVISQEAIHLLWAVSGLSVLSYAVGQFCSLVVSRGVVALFVGLLCSWLLGMWATLMTLAGVPVWFSVLPIPVVLVWAGWLRAPDWILERATWRARLKLASSVAVPLAAVAAAVISFRAYEIPAVTPLLPIAAYQQPPSRAALETALLYGQAADAAMAADRMTAIAGSEGSADLSRFDEGGAGSAMMGMGESGDVLTAAEAEELAAQQRTVALEKFREAATRADYWFPHQREAARGSVGDIPDYRVQRAHRASLSLPVLARSLLEDAARLQSESQLDEAWQLYTELLQAVRRLHERADWDQQLAADQMEVEILKRIPAWAAQFEQTAERVQSGLEQLEREHLGWTPPREPALVHEYLAAKEILNFSPAAWKKTGATSRELRTFRILAAVMPWEHARSHRLVDAAAERRRRWVLRWMPDANREFHSVAQPAPWEDQIEDWLQNTFVPPIGGSPDVSWMRQIAARQLAHRRVAQLQLLLAAHRLRHGALPQRLEDAVPAKSLGLLIDPYTNQPFWYRPAGISEQISRSQPAAPFGVDPYQISSYTPGERIIWSTHEVASIVQLWPDLRMPDEPIDAGTPFLWSAGPALSYVARATVRGAASPEPNFAHYVHRAGVRPPRQILSEDELWQIGWCIPIPAEPR